MGYARHALMATFLSLYLTTTIILSFLIQIYFNHQNQYIVLGTAPIKNQWFSEASLGMMRASDFAINCPAFYTLDCKSFYSDMFNKCIINSFVDIIFPVIRLCGKTILRPKCPLNSYIPLGGVKQKRTRSDYHPRFLEKDRHKQRIFPLKQKDVK